MNRDTRPDGHHGKNNPPKPTKQGSKGKPDSVNDNDERDEDDDPDGLIAWGREMQRRGIKVVQAPCAILICRKIRRIQAVDRQYFSSDYTIRLDDQTVNAHAVLQRTRSSAPGELLITDIFLIMDLPDNFYLSLGTHKIMLVPYNRSRPTVLYNVMLETNLAIDSYNIQFLQSGAPEEIPTQS